MQPRSLPYVALALYRKYRPATFSEVVGQEHVTDPLRTALAAGRVNHAYLFSGPRGCGKTSSARIMARSLNCVQGPTPDPCGVCPSCIALAPEGPGSLDVVELDAASHGGVDDTRDLRDKAFYMPAESRYRVFIIDEAHMVSPQGFNALLKIVEEPPEHLVFIFATTEPDKVMTTIRSRTHHYPFRLIPPATLRKLLEKLCREENVTVEPAVLPLVIRAGGGSARDSLSILDQLLAGAGPGGVTYASAVALLGVTDAALLDEMVDALAAGDGASVFGAVDKVVEAGHDPRRFAADLLQRLRDLVIIAAVPDAGAKGLIDAPEDQVTAMYGQSERLGASTLTRLADVMHTGLVDMRGTTSPRLVLELMCARMLLPATASGEGAMLQRLERLEQALSSGMTLPPGMAPSGGATAGPDQGASDGENGGGRSKTAYRRPSLRLDGETTAAAAVPAGEVPVTPPTAVVKNEPEVPSVAQPAPAVVASTVPADALELTAQSGPEPEQLAAVAGRMLADSGQAPDEPDAAPSVQDREPAVREPAARHPGQPPARSTASKAAAALGLPTPPVLSGAARNRIPDAAGAAGAAGAVDAAPVPTKKPDASPVPTNEPTHPPVPNSPVPSAVDPAPTLSSPVEKTADVAAVGSKGTGRQTVEAKTAEEGRTPPAPPFPDLAPVATEPTQGTTAASPDDDWPAPAEPPMDDEYEFGPPDAEPRRPIIGQPATKEPTPSPQTPPAPAAPEPAVPEPAAPEPAAPEPAAPEPTAPEPTAPEPTAAPVAPLPTDTASKTAGVDASSAPTTNAKAAGAAKPDSSAMGVTDVRHLWAEVLAAVQRRRRTTQILLESATVADVKDGALYLTMPSPGMARRVVEAANADLLRQALREVMGVDWAIRCDAAGDAPPSRPALRLVSNEPERPVAVQDDDTPEEYNPNSSDPTVGQFAPRDPEEVAIELLTQELGATKIE